MTDKPKFQLRVEELLRKYIDRFIRYAKFSHLPQDRREILTGALLYLVNDQDLVPDDVPNIGYLDDLAVFIFAARSFITDGKGIPGVVNLEELQEDEAFVEKHKGLIYGNSSLTIQALRQSSQGEFDLLNLCDMVKEKYTHLGRPQE